MLPFSPPRIDDEICNEVVKTLKSGWITTGPRTKEFEKMITAYCGSKSTLCLNSATAGLEIMLRWFGVGPGDEVILPAYTYSATANVIVHCGAKPVFVDVKESDFNIDPEKVKKAITGRTKAIMPVDFAGYPCDYDELNAVAEQARDMFIPDNEIQKMLGRPLVLADSAHSFGAIYRNRKMGAVTDVSVFSFHAVKNLTTAEGGAVALNLPAPFDNQVIYQKLCVSTLHGQDKDALAKTQKGNWKYDIVEAGYKCNMTDISAAIGMVELKRYDSDTLKKRKRICEFYDAAFKGDKRFRIPELHSGDKTGSYHLYPLRVNGVTEALRDAIIKGIFDRDVSVNVHFIPVPAMSFYKNLGYKLDDYPVTKACYACEISLPVYYDLDESALNTVVQAVKEATAAVC